MEYSVAPRSAGEVMGMAGVLLWNPERRIHEQKQKHETQCADA